VIFFSISPFFRSSSGSERREEGGRRREEGGRRKEEGGGRRDEGGEEGEGEFFCSFQIFRTPAFNSVLSRLTFQELLCNTEGFYLTGQSQPVNFRSQLFWELRDF
jgi:hypothetical protein